MKKHISYASAAAVALVLVGAGCSSEPVAQNQQPAGQQQAPADAFAVGTKVYARWKGGDTWYPAKVSAAANGKYSIKFDDGAEESGLAASSLALASSMGKPVVAGQKVIAKWATDGKFYTGTVISVSGSTVKLQWYDKTTYEAPLANVASVGATPSVDAAPAAAAPAPTPTPAPTATEPAPAPVVAAPSVSFKVGASVLGRWSSGQRWWEAKVTGVSADGKVMIKYDSDGSADTLAADRVASYGKAAAGLKVGDAVAAKWSDGKWYSATVTAIAGSKVTVKFYDGVVYEVNGLTNIAVPAK